MALRAGRVGILPDELTPDGKLKPVSITPAYWGKLGGVMPGDNMQINSAGVIDVNTLSVPHKIYLNDDNGTLKYSDDVNLSNAQMTIFVIEEAGQGGLKVETLHPANNNGANGYYFTSQNVDNGNLVTKIYSVNFTDKTAVLLGTTTQQISIS